MVKWLSTQLIKVPIMKQLTSLNVSVWKYIGSPCMTLVIFINRNDFKTEAVYDYHPHRECSATCSPAEISDSKY